MPFTGGGGGKEDATWTPKNGILFTGVGKVITLPKIGMPEELGETIREVV